MDNFGDWLGNLEQEAEKTRIAKEIDEKLKINEEYQKKLKTIDIQIDMINKKGQELVDEKTKLKVEYANEELKKIGSKYRYRMKNKNDPFDGLYGLFDGIFGKAKGS